mmetsp:Transcript_103656/g.299836  ORF Transcript_103656/g.299836 Transcript_103656/m.299836 type:complete len:222 (-) Transcript_103656:483-1148(-)
MPCGLLLCCLAHELELALPISSLDLLAHLLQLFLPAVERRPQSTELRLAGGDSGVHVVAVLEDPVRLLGQVLEPLLEHRELRPVAELVAAAAGARPSAAGVVPARRARRRGDSQCGSGIRQAAVLQGLQACTDRLEAPPSVRLGGEPALVVALQPRQALPDPLLRLLRGGVCDAHRGGDLLQLLLHLSAPLPDLLLQLLLHLEEAVVEAVHPPDLRLHLLA